MKLKLLFPLLVFSVIIINKRCLSQNQSSNWYFGNNAGVTFNNGSPVALTNGALATHEGVATISDNAGNLLFYTDGITVYNAAHATMSNGSGLMGDASATQAAIIVKMPLSSTQYYIFTMDDATGSSGLRFSIVDMTLNGGLGGVTSKNILVYASAKEKLTSVPHANGTDFWIIINSFSNDAISAFLLNSSGVSMSPVVSNIGPLNNGAPAGSSGYIKASRQNNRLAMGVLYNDKFVVVDFDNSTGIADSASRITLGNAVTTNNAYGVEFSPDGSILYGTTLSAPRLTLQFDLSSGIDSVIFNTRDTLEYSAISGPCGSFYFGALQLAPDGKIYGVCACDSFLNVINNPNALGSACGYVAKGVSLNGRTCDLGLPNFIPDYVLPTGISHENDQHRTGFMIYPNPASNAFKVQNLNFKPGDELKIYNILGKEICSLKIKSALTTIDVSHFVKGIYFVKMFSAGEIPVGSKKLMIE